MTPVAAVDWLAAQRALRHEVTRVTAHLRSVGDPGVPALGEWSVAEVAMHLSQSWLAVSGLVTEDLSGVYGLLPGLEGTAGASLISDVWDLSGVTTLGVESDPERDLGVLARRIEERADRFFEGLAGKRADEVRPWLVEGTTVSLPTLTCHLLNETVVHGFDIARAGVQPWVVEPASAALVLEGFLVPVLQALDPRALVDQERAGDVRATYEIRIRGGGRFLFVFHDGALTIEAPSSRRIDCHISADPAALLLVAWGRTSHWQAISRGQLMAWGRKPWLGPKFRELLRNP